MTRKIDLHTHTTASDGTLTPAELVALAARLELAAVAVTDHDTMAGVPEAMEAGERLGVEVIPGIEISTDYGGENVHVLGYGLDPASPELRPVLDWVSEDRRARNERIAGRMREDGIDISLEELERTFAGATLGRPHFARVLVEQGRAASVADAFQRWLNPGKPYYLPRTHPPMARAVEIIRRCGGVAVLAHPLQYGYGEPELRALADYAAGVGITGMETRYTGYTPAQTGALEALARERGMFTTGGSDFHGANKPDIALGSGHGTLAVPISVLEELKRRLGAERA